MAYWLKAPKHRQNRTGNMPPRKIYHGPNACDMMSDDDGGCFFDDDSGPPRETIHYYEGYGAARAGAENAVMRERIAGEVRKWYWENPEMAKKMPCSPLEECGISDPEWPFGEEIDEDEEPGMEVEEEEEEDPISEVDSTDAASEEVSESDNEGGRARVEKVKAMHEQIKALNKETEEAE